MFEHLREALRALRTGGVHPDDRRGMISQMRQTLVQARVGIEDLRAALETTRARLAAEQRELETVRRRKGLAAGINDQQTVTIAARYEEQHASRVTILEQKLAVQVAEIEIAEREMTEMTAELKQAAAGVGSGAPANADPVLGTEGAGEQLQDELDAMARSRRRAANEADAEAKLAELKRRMEK